MLEEQGGGWPNLHYFHQIDGARAGAEVRVEAAEPVPGRRRHHCSS